MSTSASRAVLDWFRTWAIPRLDAIGRTDITSNMNLPLTSDVRVQAAVGYLAQIEADVWARFDVSWEPFWGSVAGPVWDSINADMPPAVRADWDALFADPDENVKRLLKATIRTVSMLELAHAAGAD